MDSFFEKKEKKKEFSMKIALKFLNALLESSKDLYVEMKALRWTK